MFDTKVLVTFFLAWFAFASLMLGAFDYVFAYIALAEGDYWRALGLGFGFFALWIGASHALEWVREARGC